jgi:hypothetical protein
LKPDIPVVNLAGQALKLSHLKAEALVTLKLNAQEDVVSGHSTMPAIETQKSIGVSNLCARRSMKPTHPTLWQYFVRKRPDE